MVSLLAIQGVALACGGFFCDTPPVDPYDPTVVLPVAQAGEHILFGSADGVITAHILISYEGTADDFAWVLPIPGIPDVFLSSQRMFDVLDQATTAGPSLTQTENGCYHPPYTFSSDAGDADTDADADSDSDADTGPYDPPQVEVVSQQEVGPYESVVLRADDAEVLVSWLQDNGYSVPDSFAGAVAPYVSPEMSFLALKLLKDASTGDIAPIGISWPGDRASIPLSLTAVAATADMPITVYLSGPGRGVPLSWLHVDLNPLGLPWYPDSLSLRARLGKAVDEAGGDAFTTTYASTARVHVPEVAIAGLARHRSALRWFRALPEEVTDDPALIPILDEYLPRPDGVGLEFYNRPEDYRTQWAILDDGFDAGLATDAVDERIVAPRAAANALLRAGTWLTRLDTVVSPEEMTVDPLFGFNPDLPGVDNRPRAVETTECDRGEQAYDGWRKLGLPGGFTVTMPSLHGLDGESTASWIEQHLVHSGLVVSQLSESGPGEVLADWSSELRALDTPPPGEASDDGGSCGCSAAPRVALALPLALLGLVARRRRA